MRDKALPLMVMIALVATLGMVYVYAEEAGPLQATKTLKVKEEFSFRDLNLRLVRVNENDVAEETDDSAEFVLRTPTTSQDITIREFHSEFIDESGLELILTRIEPQKGAPGKGEVDIKLQQSPSPEGAEELLMNKEVTLVMNQVKMGTICARLQQALGVQVLCSPGLVERRISVVYQQGNLRGLLALLAEQYGITGEFKEGRLLLKEPDLTRTYVMEDCFGPFSSMVRQFLSRNDAYSVEHRGKRGMLVVTASEATHQRIEELKRQIEEACAGGTKRVADASQSFTLQVLLLGTPGLDEAGNLGKKRATMAPGMIPGGMPGPEIRGNIGPFPGSEPAPVRNLGERQGNKVYEIETLLENPEEVPQEIRWLDFDLKALQTFGIKKFTMLGSAINKCSLGNSASVTIGDPEKRYYDLDFKVKEMVLPAGASTAELEAEKTQLNVEYDISRRRGKDGLTIMRSREIIIPLGKAVILGATIGGEESLIAILRVLPE